MKSTELKTKAADLIFNFFTSNKIERNLALTALGISAGLFIYLLILL